MADTIEIELSEEGGKGRYVASVGGQDRAGELTYSESGDDKVTADHTFVDESLRGRGIGRALVERLVADARAKGFEIVPLCPFVKAQLERNADWQDVVAD